jgi:hypothetical protein
MNRCPGSAKGFGSAPGRCRTALASNGIPEATSPAAMSGSRTARGASGARRRASTVRTASAPGSQSRAITWSANGPLRPTSAGVDAMAAP